MKRSVFLLSALSLALSAALPAHAADPWPSKPVTLIVPFPAGGSTDLVTRVVAEKMSANLGQQIVIDNRGGAGGCTRYGHGNNALSPEPPRFKRSMNERHAECPLTAKIDS